MNIHIDQNPGFIPGARRWSKRTNVTGETYWHVEEDIGYMPFADRIKVRVEKVFPDGQCIVTDGDTRKTRNSHVRKLIRYDSKK